MNGTKVQLRSREFVVPSLTFDEVVQFATDGTLTKVPANGITMLTMPESREAAMVVLLSALKHNYPEITREDIGRELDLDNCEAAMAAVMGSSKLFAKEKNQGEVVP